MSNRLDAIKRNRIPMSPINTKKTGNINLPVAINSPIHLNHQKYHQNYDIIGNDNISLQIKSNNRHFNYDNSLLNTIEEEKRYSNFSPIGNSMKGVTVLPGARITLYSCKTIPIAELLVL